jgi:hypothetical protein
VAVSESPAGTARTTARAVVFEAEQVATKVGPEETGHANAEPCLPNLHTWRTCGPVVTGRVRLAL